MNILSHTAGPLSAAIALCAILTFSGCGAPGESAPSASGEEGGSDRIGFRQDGSQGFIVLWDKGSSGYSELSVDSGSVASDARGDIRLMSDNYTGMHNLACGIETNYGSSASIHCSGSGPSVTGGTMSLDKIFTMSRGTTYKVYITFGAVTHQTGATGYTLLFDGNSVMVGS